MKITGAVPLALGNAQFAARGAALQGTLNVDMAVSAVKAGAFDFIEKPFDETRLLASIRDAVEKGRQRLNDAVHLIL